MGDPFVHLTTAALALPAEKRSALSAALLATLRAHPEVESATDVYAMRGATCPPAADESIPALVCRSLPREPGPAAFYVVLREGSFFDTGYTPGAGISHGSPRLADRAIPLLVRAPGRVKAGVRIEEPLPFTTFVRTAAALLGTRPPTGAGPGPDLTTR